MVPATVNALAQVPWGLTDQPGHREKCYGKITMGRFTPSKRKPVQEHQLLLTYDLNFQIHFFGTLTLCGCAALHSWLDVGASSHLSVIIIIPGNSAVWVPQAS